MQVEHKIFTISFIAMAVAILVLSLARPLSIGAQYYNQGDNNNSVTVVKKVRSLNETVYFENIDVNKRVFIDNDLIEFSITIQNSGKNDLVDVKVTDTLPKYLSLLFYPGVYNKTDNKIEWLINRLAPGESKNFLIRAKISGVKNAGLSTAIKMTNTADARNNIVSDSDSASYFVGLKSIPKTGDASLPIKTGVIVLSLTAGMAFRKYARGY